MNGRRFALGNRVRRRSDFVRAYTGGARTQGRYMAVFLVPNGLPAARLGVAATRKLGSAVKRNRAKRLAREIFRRHPIAESFDVIIVPRREILDAPFSNLEADYLSAVERNRSQRKQRSHSNYNPRRRPRV